MAKSYALNIAHICKIIKKSAHLNGINPVNLAHEMLLMN